LIVEPVRALRRGIIGSQAEVFHTLFHWLV
jgi:hypothetical protein